MWVVIGMAEITAAGIYVEYWLPERAAVDPRPDRACRAVRGQPDRGQCVWRVRVLVRDHQGGHDHRHDPASAWRHPVRIQRARPDGSFSNLWSHGGFFPKGLGGRFSALQIVMFAFLGVELIGVTAGEAQNPEKTLPSAINKRDLADPDLLHRRPDRSSCRSSPGTSSTPSESPFVVVFDRDRHPGGRGDHQLRRDDRRAVLMQ